MTDLEVHDRLKLDKETVKKLLCEKASDGEIALFLELCKARNINPFIKEAYLVKYDATKPAQIVTSKEYFLRRAGEHPSYEGFEAGIVVEDKGDILYRQGSILLEGQKLIGGWALVYRNGRKPTRSEISRSEFDKKQSNWVTMPGLMCRKVAIVSALREGFPDEFNGLVDEAEMGVIEASSRVVQKETDFFTEKLTEVTESMYIVSDKIKPVVDNFDFEVLKKIIDGYTFEEFTTKAPDFFIKIKPNISDDDYAELHFHSKCRWDSLKPKPKPTARVFGPMDSLGDILEKADLSPE
jgi:hypothetical protein